MSFALIHEHPSQNTLLKGITTEIERRYKIMDVEEAEPQALFDLHRDDSQRNKTLGKENAIPMKRTNSPKAAGNNNMTETTYQGSKRNETTHANQAQQDNRDNNSNRGFMPEIPRLSGLRFVAFRAFALDTLQLPKILFNAGALSYLLFSIKLLWKVSTMFQSQPHAIALGFVPPSVVIFTLVQRYAPIQVRAEAEGMDSVILQTAIDMTILTGAFICISITWLIISVVGEFVAVMLLVYHLYTIFCLNYIH
ncbi:uncharacterized protein C8R40DRAFT_1175997 [Lentinula edodes]|uniref:uncharacterized protein n=1 Tax=Lentinula edodes TaxID=5353 RepID=UPI001E8E26C5|nr:uncharacterized protein C8R40DRAFT_1175997 [Lentinula edodes]KAH7870086.1 hypothetical protein C8R40DRAFT_1175997 [Lentinula edodes]